MFLPMVKRCPDCDGLLRVRDVPGGFPGGRYLAVQLVLWLAVVLGLTALTAPGGEREIYAGLAFAAGVVWWLMWPRQRADAEALLARRQYHCVDCGERFEGSDLHRLGQR
jgi:hypothetical protein